jgi:hypothetical protein
MNVLVHGFDVFTYLLKKIKFRILITDLQESEYYSEALEEFDYWLSRVERKLATTLKKPTTRPEASQILASTKVSWLTSKRFFDPSAKLQ